MCNFSSISLLLISVGYIYICSAKQNKSHDWDILIFTQHWPLTVCLQWKETQAQHSCIFPPVKNIWTVHGIWPTKLGKWGPEYCNVSLHFNKTQLEPIEQELEQYWTDIHNGSTYKLWKHEWTKHGTCAAALHDLDMESKYFGQGLKWINQYQMANILGMSGIQPNNRYTAETVWNAVQKWLGKNPAVQCTVDPKTNETYLFQIKICFDKNLTLTDCDGIKGTSDPATGIKTNCPLKETFVYPSILPPEYGKPLDTIERPVYGQHSWLLEALHVIQFLQWMTS
ncbi:Ribonuclease Oy [Cryptotermes secundus]|uniref:Ribonuclease Oy n=1 Tax=Cryptotermes secundus TaxID=105785 RepID=A0A2J7PTZ5_9NEOP|nr:ribonuclease Oy [Cryptotermes secundus]PNF19797.1 Ribonuclease Oy [Cryptotermes secundus]